LSSNIASWQESVGFYCICAHCGPNPCTTPALDHTWGQIKTLYR
jgi:hypothetical protein